MARLDFRGGAAKCTATGAVGSGDTSIALTGDTSGWPTGASGRNFAVVLDRGVAGKMEKILCSALGGGALTVVTRGYDGTSPLAHDPNCTVEHGLTASVLDDLSQHVYDTSRDDHAQYVRVDGTRGFADVDDLVDAPVNVGTSNNEGISTKFSRADHVHDIANDAVGSAQIAPDAVGTSEIAANAVGASELADAAVDTAAIVDGAVTLVKMGGGLAIITYSGTTDASGQLSVSYSALPFTVTNVAFAPTGDARATTGGVCFPMLFSLGNPMKLSFYDVKNGAVAIGKSVAGTIIAVGT